MSLLIIPSGQDSSELVKRILATDICVSDLDDTDAESPAKIVAKDFRHYGINPAYWYWLVKAGINHSLDGKRSESDSWKEFAKRFLRNKDELERVKNIFTPEKVRSTLYPGVEEFYDLLPREAIKAYVTRNIQEIALAYADILGITAIWPKQYDKFETIKQIFEKSRTKKRWLVKGDSEEDLEMLSFLKFQKVHGKIDDVIGIYVTDEKLNPKFDVNLFRDYTGLVRLMKRQ